VVVPILIVLAIVVVLAGVVFVAAGRGGEMPAVERTDYYPLELGPVSATDVVLLRPQMALWGYNQQMVDDALDHIADSIRDRDVRIVALEQLVTDLTREPVPTTLIGSPYPGARHARPMPEYQVPGRPELEHPVPEAPENGRVADEVVEDEVLQDEVPEAELDEAGPIGAPVPDPPEYPGQPAPDLASRAADTGWPPEVSHD
jgi:hypothetical protein